MILGRIVGKVTTNDFSFKADKQTHNFEYVQVMHSVYQWVLCQIVAIEKDDQKTIAKCNIIGYKDQYGKIKKVMMPLEPGSEVLQASNDFIKEIVKLEDSKRSAFVGKLDGRNIPVNLDLNKLLTKHVAVVAKSGAGKSYAVGVLIEEIAEKGVPVLVIDPHGEYSAMAKKNENEEEIKQMRKYDIEPAAYAINEFGDPKVGEVRPLKLSNEFTNNEFIHLFPGKLSTNQMAILYSALKNLHHLNFTNLLLELENEENPAKWSLINVLEYLNSLEIFSETPTPDSELLQSGKISIINMRGINPDIQQIIVYKLCKDLFEKRKTNKVPPFFLVIEEAHNYCPERSFGETKCSRIIRTIASEGRKFGLGLCVITQRPARIDKSVLSQCTTQIILKVTNPNDLKAVSSSVEGLTLEAEQEIQNLAVGTALITGIVDLPLLVNIRTRKSMHGGHAIDMLQQEDSFLDRMQDFRKQELLPVIRPNISLKDLQLMSEKPDSIRVQLVPSLLFNCKEQENRFSILVDRMEGSVIINKDEFTTKRLIDMDSMREKELEVFISAVQLKEAKFNELSEKVPDSSQEINSLVDKKLLVNDNEVLKIPGNLILSNLSNYPSFDKIEFVQVKYDEKLEAKADSKEIERILNRFVTVLDKSECFVIRYLAE